MKRNQSTEHDDANTLQQGAATTKSNREELILSAMPLVRGVAGHLMRRLPPTIAIDDLTSAGTVGLIKAADRFDRNRGLSFTTYAKHRILGEMLDFLRTLDPLSRAQRRRQREFGGDAGVPAPGPAAPQQATEPVLFDCFLRAQILTARRSLTINEDRVIALSFFGGWSNREIAQTLASMRAGSLNSGQARYQNSGHTDRPDKREAA